MPTCFDTFALHRMQAWLEAPYQLAPALEQLAALGFRPQPAWLGQLTAVLEQTAGQLDEAGLAAAAEAAARMCLGSPLEPSAATLANLLLSEVERRGLKRLSVGRLACLLAAAHTLCGGNTHQLTAQSRELYTKALLQLMSAGPQALQGLTAAQLVSITSALVSEPACLDPSRLTQLAGQLTARRSEVQPLLPPGFTLQLLRRACQLIRAGATDAAAAAKAVLGFVQPLLPPASELSAADLAALIRLVLAAQQRPQPAVLSAYTSAVSADLASRLAGSKPSASACQEACAELEAALIDVLLPVLPHWQSSQEQVEVRFER